MEGRKASWPLWIAAVLLLLPVLYVASIGPASYLVRDREKWAGPDPVLEPLSRVYSPLTQHSPEWFHAVLGAYCRSFDPHLRLLHYEDLCRLKLLLGSDFPSNAGHPRGFLNNVVD